MKRPYGHRIENMAYSHHIYTSPGIHAYGFMQDEKKLNAKYVEFYNKMKDIDYEIIDEKKKRLPSGWYDVLITYIVR